MPLDTKLERFKKYLIENIVEPTCNLFKFFDGIE